MPDNLDRQINLNFRITEGERRAFKEWCARGGTTQSAAFRDSFTLLKLITGELGVQEPEVLKQALRGIQSISIDAALDLTVERRGADTWAVCVGRSVVMRDLTRVAEPMSSSRTEEFISATRFSLAEAMRIASAFQQKNIDT